MIYQISNKEIVSYLINEVYKLDKRKYLFTGSNLRARKNLLPNLQEANNYKNVGKEFIKRTEADEYSGFDIQRRRACYYFFRERFQKAYAEILCLPLYLLDSKRYIEKDLEEQFKGYFNKHVATLPNSKISEIIAYCYNNLKLMTKVVWIDLKEGIKKEEDFVVLLQNKISFVLGESISELEDIEALTEALRKDFVLLVFNGCRIVNKFKCYKQLKEVVQSNSTNPVFNLKIIEVFLE